MKELFVKITPFLFGILFSVMLFWSPPFLEDLGALRLPIQAAFAVLTLLAFLALTISKSLPRNVAITAASSDRIDAEMEGTISRIESLGFTRSDQVYEIAVSPPAILVPLIDETQTVYSTVFKTGTIPSKVAWDFVSIAHQRFGGLTTVAIPDGVALPASPGSLRQVAVNADIPQALDQHREAQRYTESKGLGWMRLSLRCFPEDFRFAMNHERDAFLRNPLWYALVALKRTITKHSPHLGPIASQKAADRTIADIVEGRTVGQIG